MQTSVMKACFLITECSLPYAKIMQFAENAKRKIVFYTKITPFTMIGIALPYFSYFEKDNQLVVNS